MKKSGIVNLSVHRNTKESRARKTVARQMIRAAREINEDKQIKGYVIVAWTDEYDGRADWHLEGVESSRSTPERVKQILINAFDQARD